ncbi:cytochrome c oxidase subunit 7A2, mitochondrial [Pseudophryne corroboree]|uniref:cytochrome c oxidase subunit 7A2, mitochondrial n=1 Tax=Pseudophryne corroboree TaxID=495146 RepID=UPI003081E304
MLLTCHTKHGRLFHPPKQQVLVPCFRRNATSFSGYPVSLSFCAAASESRERSISSTMFRNLLALRPISQRTFSTSTRKSLQNKVAEKQKLFQEDNGLPVHLKAGLSDALMYRLTMGITLFGTLYSIFEIVKASLPQKQK